MNPTIIDPKIKRHFRRYAAQVSLTALLLFGVLWVEQLIAGPEVARAVIVGAVAATAFILFISPHRPVASPRSVLGGYAIALVIASGLTLLMATGNGTALLAEHPVLFPFGAALSVGGAMFTMAAVNMEHPPGAGAALAIAAHGFNWELLAFVAASVTVMSALQRLIRKWLIDLY